MIEKALRAVELNLGCTCAEGVEVVDQGGDEEEMPPLIPLTESET
jgi:hypothetical protein